jgi:hypothetical protein
VGEAADQRPRPKNRQTRKICTHHLRWSDC